MAKQEKFIEHKSEAERGRGHHSMQASAHATWAGQEERKGNKEGAAKERALAAAHYEKAAEYASKEGHASAESHRKAAASNKERAAKLAGGAGSAEKLHESARSEVSGAAGLRKPFSEGVRISAKGLNADQRQAVENALQDEQYYGGNVTSSKEAAKALREAGRESEAGHFDRAAAHHAENLEKSKKQSQQLLSEHAEKGSNLTEKALAATAKTGLMGTEQQHREAAAAHEAAAKAAPDAETAKAHTQQAQEHSRKADKEKAEASKPKSATHIAEPAHRTASSLARGMSKSLKAGGGEHSHEDAAKAHESAAEEHRAKAAEHKAAGNKLAANAHIASAAVHGRMAEEHKKEHELQTGARGGQYYMSESGQKVYTKK